MIVKETIRITPSGESAAYDRILAGTGASFHWRSPITVRRSAFGVRRNVILCFFKYKAYRDGLPNNGCRR